LPLSHRYFMSHVSGNCAESARVSHAVVQMDMIESWSVLIWSSLKVLLYCSVVGQYGSME
jgi:hypothetical protein